MGWKKSLKHYTALCLAWIVRVWAPKPSRISPDPRTPKSWNLCMQHDRNFCAPLKDVAYKAEKAGRVGWYSTRDVKELLAWAESLDIHKYMYIPVCFDLDTHTHSSAHICVVHMVLFVVVSVLRFIMLHICACVCVVFLFSCLMLLLFWHMYICVSKYGCVCVFNACTHVCAHV